MSHDIEASYAAMEVVNHYLANPEECFNTVPAENSLSGYAAREGRHEWPHADGVIELAVTGSHKAEYSVALEYKRPNEGLHGVLTAMGQAHAYIRKGYSGTIIVIPDAYPSYSGIGGYVKDVLDMTSKHPGIGVATYLKPDLSKISPFSEKLVFHRKLAVDTVDKIDTPILTSKTETQWAHIREGSSDPDAFFKYLQSVKLLGGSSKDILRQAIIPPELQDAAHSIRDDIEPERYLSNSPGGGFVDEAWRYFWFTYVLHPDAIKGWFIDDTGIYHANNTESRIERSDGNGKKMFFAGRSDSIKTKLVKALNQGQLSEEEALKKLVQNYFNRAHSYREDVDSGCEHLGFVDGAGRLTDIGYRFVDACERYGNPNEGVPRSIFLEALLVNGSLGAFIHYVHKLSDELFSENPDAFSVMETGRKKFQQNDYLLWIEGQLEKRLRVLRKVSTRGGTARKPFQAELAVLRGMGIISKGFRPGVGLVVNWPEFNEATLYRAGY